MGMYHRIWASPSSLTSHSVWPQWQWPWCVVMVVGVVGDGL